MPIGQAYSDILSIHTQKALEAGCDILIDGCFEALENIKEPEDIADTILAEHLPERYLYRYTPLFLKQFVVCIITVAWKLAQPAHMPLSSLAEELAAWAIINQTKALAEDNKGTEGATIEDDLEAFIDAYFEDLDFEFLFDNTYDGIDETALAQTLGMSSLALNTWFTPFSDEPSRIPHPYVQP